MDFLSLGRMYQNKKFIDLILVDVYGLSFFLPRRHYLERNLSFLLTLLRLLLFVEQDC